MEKEIKGEYVAPKINIIEMKITRILCSSGEDYNFDEI